MNESELRKKIIAVLESKYGHTHLYSPADVANRACTTVFEGVNGRPAARSLSFGEVADAALEAFFEWGDDAEQ